MALRRRTVKVDDLDGTQGDDIRTVRFALDGNDYRIDLTVEHHRALRTALDRYLCAARPRSQEPETGIYRVLCQTQRAFDQDVRQWARHAGYYVTDHGTIPQDVRVAFNAGRRLPPPPKHDGWLGVFAVTDS